MFWNWKRKELILFDFETATFDTGNVAGEIQGWKDGDAANMNTELRLFLELSIPDARKTLLSPNYTYLSKKSMPF